MSPKEIAWVAGIYEGEGTCVFRPSGGIQVQVTQVNSWLPSRLQEMFGGSIWLRKRTSKNPQYNACHYWSIYGPRAVGFLLTIYPFLSPRRRATIDSAIPAWRRGKVNASRPSKGWEQVCHVDSASVSYG